MILSSLLAVPLVGTILVSSVDAYKKSSTTYIKSIALITSVVKYNPIFVNDKCMLPPNISKFNMSLISNCSKGLLTSVNNVLFVNIK